MSPIKVPQKLKSWFRKKPQTPKDLNQNSKEIIIIVMGATGAGKSTFINEATGKDSMVVGHEIESCTSTINTVKFDDPQLLSKFAWLEGRSLILVDTPGFDDTYKEDVEILEGIANWLVESYSSRMLAGVVYLHDISLDRYTGTSKKNLRMFQGLCGQEALDMVTLGATKWQRSGGIVVAQKRLDQLKSNHWKDIIADGARAILLGVDGQVSEQVVFELLKRFEQRFRDASLQTTSGVTVKPTTTTGLNAQSHTKDDTMASVRDKLPPPPDASKPFPPVCRTSDAAGTAHTVEHFRRASVEATSGTTVAPTADTGCDAQSRTKDDPMASVFPQPPDASRSFPPVCETSGAAGTAHTVEHFRDASVEATSGATVVPTADTGCNPQSHTVFPPPPDAPRPFSPVCETSDAAGMAHTIEHFGDTFVEATNGATVTPTADTGCDAQSHTKDNTRASVLPPSPDDPRSLSPVCKTSEASFRSNTEGTSHTIEHFRDASVEATSGAIVALTAATGCNAQSHAKDQIIASVRDGLPPPTDASEPVQSEPNTIKQMVALAIQHELVDKNLIVPQTTAGQELRYTLRQILDSQKRMAQLSKGTEKGDHEAEAELEEARKEIEALTQQLQKLKVPLGRKLLNFLHSL